MRKYLEKASRCHLCPFLAEQTAEPGPRHFLPVALAGRGPSARTVRREDRAAWRRSVRTGPRSEARQGLSFLVPSLPALSVQ